MSTPSMPRRNAIKSIAACALFISAGAIFSACSKSQPEFRGVDLSQMDYARDFAPLKDHNGQQRSIQDFRGKVVVVFFGYTQCPDVCPTSMQEMAEVKKMLGADGERLQSIFITVDPERDTPDMLKAYMANFDPSFVALRATPDKLSALAKDYKIYYKKVEGKTPTSYSMDHSAGSYVYDTQGRLRLFTRYGSGPKPLTEDIRQLLK